TNQLAAVVHDPIDARAVAFSDGTSTVVVVSVVAQGIFNAYQPDLNGDIGTLGTKDMRARAQQLRPGITDMIVSANHNESSPDSIGIYGAPAPDPSPVGLRSGIDDYYMAFLVERVAQAAAAAYDGRRPATIGATSFLL